MIYIEINDKKYPAYITGRLNDADWNNRSSKAITVEMSYEEALSIFVDDVDWNIVEEFEETVEKLDENGKIVYTSIIRTETYDNSEYSIAGDIINHRNGEITVKMGKPTAEELLAMIEEALFNNEEK